MECKKLKAKRYLSDGQCYSERPIVDDVCVGACLPLKEKNLPWWSEFYKYWSKNKVKEYRCVEDRVKRKKVMLICRDGSVRHYRIKVVKSCKCKAYTRDENKTKRNRKNRDRNHRRRRHRKRQKSRRRRHRKNRDRKHRRNRKNRNNRKTDKKINTDSKNTWRTVEYSISLFIFLQWKMCWSRYSSIVNARFPQHMWFTLH